MRLCFLDFDGVLNSDRYFAANPRVKENENLDPAAIGLLCDFLDRTHCQVVVSSTWRIGSTVQELRDILSERGFRQPERVIGKTTERTMNRGRQIDAYLKKLTRADVQFVIFDDDGDMEPHMENFVMTDGRVGLTKANLSQAQRILER